MREVRSLRSPDSGRSSNYQFERSACITRVLAYNGGRLIPTIGKHLAKVFSSRAFVSLYVARRSMDVAASDHRLTMPQLRPER